MLDTFWGQFTNAGFCSTKKDEEYISVLLLLPSIIYCYLFERSAHQTYLLTLHAAWQIHPYMYPMSCEYQYDQATFAELPAVSMEVSLLIMRTRVLAKKKALRRKLTRLTFRYVHIPYTHLSRLHHLYQTTHLSSFLRMYNHPCVILSSHDNIMRTEKPL